jgi:hypothetical protein
MAETLSAWVTRSDLTLNGLSSPPQAAAITNSERATVKGRHAGAVLTIVRILTSVAFTGQRTILPTNLAVLSMLYLPLHDPGKRF